tara:strand:- start:15539 stop:16318 length:780 start_codon:yes stop_codon:yes gene_type:complete
MYTAPQKKFTVKPIAEIEQELLALANDGYSVDRVFLADGDAMTLSVRRLTEILTTIKQYYPNVRRVSAYCLPRNLKNKSVAELTALRELGLDYMYVGCETGDDELLGLIEKGEDYQSSLSALQKIKQAGMTSSVMILNGIGGPNYSAQHAKNSARLMNEAQPNFLSMLVLELPNGDQRFAKNFKDQWRKLNQNELFEEMRSFISQLELDKTIFRSDHASNYLVLKGTLGKDKEKLLEILDTAINKPGLIPLREEWQRGL